MRRASCATVRQLVRVIVAVGPGRDDFAVAMLALGMVDQPHHAERPVLHCPKFRTRHPPALIHSRRSAV